MKWCVLWVTLVALLPLGCDGPKKDTGTMPSADERFDKSKEMKGKRPGPGAS